MESGLWKQSDLVDFSNEVLRDYYLSPAVNAGGQELAEQFWQEEEYRRQPYLRGYILARNWEAEWPQTVKPM